MQAAILGLVEGSPDDPPIESRLDGSIPAIDAQQTAYLDGATLSHGTAAVGTTYQDEEIHITDDAIVTETVEAGDTVTTDFVADLSDGGFVGIDTGRADRFWELLEMAHDVRIERARIDVDAFASDVAADGTTWQVGATRLDDDGAQIAYHEDAALGGVEGELTQYGFKYQSEAAGFVRGTVAASGYVAVFSLGSPAKFGRWLCDDLLPYAELPDDGQQLLAAAADDSDGCEECGREPERGSLTDGLCAVCYDKVDRQGGEA